MGQSPTAPAPASPPAYEDLFPYYAEVCALTELRKKPGFGAPLRSGMGGHALLYLNGVRRDAAQDYPVLRLCGAEEQPARHGCGVSVNSHYSNANWVAVEGREFFWRGALAVGEPLTRAAYARTQAQAQGQNCFAGVTFHPALFAAKPPGMSDRDYMYEISAATDYGAQFGRDSLRVRIPLDAARMAALIAWLNALNAPYRRGQRLYVWRLFNDNCVHVVHNALAAAGIWAPWPTGRAPLLTAFNFPVPKNAVVDLLRRANDLPLDDPRFLFEDAALRHALATTGTLPTAPGALLSRHAAIAPNEVYDIAKLRLIFYDNTVASGYRARLRRMLATPRYTSLAANLRHFAARYAAARARPRPRHLSRARGLFQEQYEQHLAAAAARTSQLLARLEGVA